MTKPVFSRGRIGQQQGRSGVRMVVDIEEACHAVNAINRRIKVDQREVPKKPVTLPSSLDAWLKRNVE